MTSLSGISLHTGVPSTVRIVPRPEDGLGLRFFFPGFPRGLDARALAALPRSAGRATVLTSASGAVVRTPEHLLAAALFYAVEPLDIHCDAQEIPGLDGSARPWFTALAAAAPRSSPKPEYRAHAWEHAGPEGRLRAEPAEHFSVEYSWEDGDVREYFALPSLAEAPREVLPARTFIPYRDWKKLAGGRDLLAGAGRDSGLLIAASAAEFAAGKKNLPESDGNTFPLLHPAAFRMQNELARHKVLDLLGDLALNGLALPRLRLTVANGGHALNHLLLDALQKHGTKHTHTIPQGVAP
jgi:UDP-3-O-acyl-N-acetylglucosamine deacetylase